MGAAGSKEGSDPGIITVVPAAPSFRHGSSSNSRGAPALPLAGGHNSSRPSSRLSSRAVTPTNDDPLMQHLRDLKAQGAKLDSALFAAVGRTPSSSSSAPSASSKQQRPAGAATTQLTAAAAAASASDPDSLLADLAVAQQLSSDTAVLNAAITSIVTDYQAWHRQHIQALTQNQEYITRTMDQAEAKADKVVRQVQQQTTKLRQLSAGLSKAAQLPALLQQLTAATEGLELQLGQLEQRADAVAVAAAAAAGAGAEGSAGSTAAAAAGKSSAAAQPSSSSGTGSGTPGAALSKAGSSSGNGRAGSFRSWLGVGTGAGSQQQPGSKPQQQEQQQQQQQPSN